MKSAYLDLGTNTFELLIAEHHSARDYQFIDRHLIPCFLGEGSYSTGKADQKSIDRSLEALNALRQRAKDFGAEYIIAAGTSAMRDYGLKKLIETIPDIQGRVIDGKEEARLVRNAMMESARGLKGNTLYLDIGGGSVELSATGEIEYSESMNLGVRRLKENLSIPDEPAEEDIQKIEKALLDQLDKWPKLNQVQHLIGCSGTMETLFDLLQPEIISRPDLSESSSKHAITIMEKWIKAKLEDRLSEKLISDFRASMLPIGFCLINTLLKTYNIPKLYYSKFGLKEALFFEDIKERYA